MRVPSRYMGGFSESSFPLLDGFIVFVTKICLVFWDCFTASAIILPYVWWIHFVEHGYHCQALRFSAVQYFHQLIQAPLWSSIVFGEYDDGKLWILNCLAQWGPKLVSFLKVVVIHVCFDVVPGESRTKMANEAGADILTPEANKNLVLSRTQWWQHALFRHSTSSLSGLQMAIGITTHAIVKFYYSTTKAEVLHPPIIMHFILFFDILILQ